jgi:uncharacterized protein (DUF2236 family)
VRDLRQRIGELVIARVAGPDARVRRDRILDAPGERWFAEDRPIRRVHADASMFVGGLRALLLQSLHPLAMAGVAGHSGYRGDPWGRLQRTSYFLAVTTYGLAEDAEEAVAHVQRIHQHVRGTAPDGRAYAASDPHLLRWVHIAEVDSFLSTYQTYGRVPLTPSEQDEYLVDAAKIARALGVTDPPLSVAELDYQIRGYRPELHGTPEARSAARFMLIHPPLPLLVRPAYAALAGAAVASLPVWARLPLHLPYLPIIETPLTRGAGTAIVRTIRWATTLPS